MTISPPVSSHGHPATDNRPLILVVNAVRHHLGVYSRRLGEAGYRVIGTPDIHRAMAELHRSSIDLVLADLRTARNGATDLVRMIRSDEVNRHLPVVLVAGRSDAAGTIAAYRCGADAVVAKPFHFDVLLARLGREIERSAALRELRRDNQALDARIVSRAIELGETRDLLQSSEKARLQLEAMVSPKGA